MSEKMVITQTKVIVPQRRWDMLSRQRLLDYLNELLDFRLIIIAAPAGYGKTTLMIDFAHQFEWPVCWFALEPLDQDIASFLSHFVYSIRQKFPDFGNQAIQMLEESPDEHINLDLFITYITNDIYEHITEHFLIVLDDYHLLGSNPEIDQFLSSFIQRADENCHLAITSRRLLTLPDLPLMVARSQVGGLSAEELAFQPDEIINLFNNIFKQPISPREALKLSTFTEGWITGLLLTSQTSKHGLGERINITRASGIGLYEYLARQVLDLQPVEIQDFLLNTAYLEEFNAEMCEQVVGGALNKRADWNFLMNAVIYNNLFVFPVGEDALWLRYHHLFRDFLQSAIIKTRPDDAARIRQRLGEYFLARNNWEKAFEIFKMLGKDDAIANMIQQGGPEFLSKGRIQKLAKWLSALPGKMVMENINLLSLQASVAVNQGNIEEGHDLLNLTINKLRSLPESEKQLADNLIRRSIALRVLGKYDMALDDADEAIELTRETLEMEDLYSEALRAKGFISYQKGWLREGLVNLEKAVEICERNNQQGDMARMLVEIGTIQEAIGQLQAAEQSFTRSLKYWQSVGDSSWQATLLNNLGVLQHARGDFTSSFNSLEKSMHYSQLTGNQSMEGYSLASIGDLYRDLSAYEESQDAYQKAHHIALQTGDQFLTFYLNISHARLFLILNQQHKAEVKLRAAKKIAEENNSQYEINKYHLEQGAFHIFSRKYENALTQLQKSLDFFTQEGHIDDQARNQVLLFLAFINVGRTADAFRALKDITASLNAANYAHAAHAATFECKAILKPLLKKKDIAKKLSVLTEGLSVYQKQTQKNRRAIRQKATVVPFAPAKLEIKAFGKPVVTSSGNPLSLSDWKTQTARDLFFLFLGFPEGLTKEEVGEILWPNSSPSQLKLRFKNAIYRMRHAVGTDVVVFQDTYYLFNRTIDYEYDLQQFINAIGQADTAKTSESRMHFLQTAVLLYNGPYLESIEYPWVMPDRQKYLSMYLKVVQELSDMWIHEKDYYRALKLCLTALDQDPYNESLHREVMQLHAYLGNQAAVTRHYISCRKMLQRDLSTQPSQQTTDLYHSLLQRQKK